MVMMMVMIVSGKCMYVCVSVQYALICSPEMNKNVYYGEKNIKILIEIGFN